MGNYYNAEQSNKLRGFLFTVLIHTALLLVFIFFYLAPPNPPLSELELGGGGVELNYGWEDVGTGDPSNLEESAPEIIEEDMVAVTPADPEEFITGDEESVVIPSEENEHRSEDITVKEETNTPTQEVKSATVKKPDSRFTMNKTDNNKSGDDKNTSGDPGKREGTLDGRALLGEAGKGGGKGGGTGTGNGPNLGGGLAGWRFLKQPKVNDQTSEKGRLTFKIFVNEDGMIENAIVIENLGGITPKLQLEYKNSLIGSELESINGVTLTSSITGTVVWEISAK